MTPDATGRSGVLGRSDVLGLALLLAWSVWPTPATASGGGSGGQAASGGTSASPATTGNSGGQGTASDDRSRLGLALTSRALKTSILNGVMEYAGGHRQAAVKIMWEFLPVAPSVQLDALRRRIDVIELPEFRNQDLQNNTTKEILVGQWLKVAKSTKYRNASQPTSPNTEYTNALGLLGNAIFGTVTTPKEFVDRTTAQGLKALTGHWLTEHEVGGERRWPLADFETGADAFNVLRDLSALITLLQSNGITVWATLADPQTHEPLTNARFVSGLQPVNDAGHYRVDDVAWHVRLWQVQPEGALRAAIVAEVPAAVLQVDKPADEESEVEVPVSLAVDWLVEQGRPLTRQALDAHTLVFGLAAPPSGDPAAQLLADLDKAKAASELDTVLSFAGGVGFDAVVARGFLAGNPNTTVVTGALLAEGGRVQPTVGALYQIDPAAPVRTGPMLTLGEDNAFFGGWGFQWQSMTLGLGARVGLKSGKTDADFGVLVGFDLSQALTGRRQPKRVIPVADPVAGGGWGLTSEALDSLTRDLTVVAFRFQDPPLDEKDHQPAHGVSFTLVQTLDADNNKLAKDAVPARRVVTPDTGPIFMLAGTYQVVAPAGYQLVQMVAGAPTPQPELPLKRQPQLVPNLWLKYVGPAEPTPVKVPYGTFEDATLAADGLPDGATLSLPDDYTAAVVLGQSHGGKGSLLLARRPVEKPDHRIQDGTLQLAPVKLGDVPADQVCVVSGWLCVQGAGTFAGLQVEAPPSTTRSSPALLGPADWTKVEVTVDGTGRAMDVQPILVLSGSGSVLLDDLECVRRPKPAAPAGEDGTQ